MIKALSIPEMLVNMFEAVIFSYFVYNCISLYFKKNAIIILFTVNTFLTTICSNYIDSAPLRCLILVIFSSFLILLLSNEKNWHPFIISIVYSFMAFFAEKITLVILQSIPNFSMYNALNTMNTLRYISCAIYLLVFFTLSILIIKLNNIYLSRHEIELFVHHKRYIPQLLILLFFSSYLMDEYFINISILSDKFPETNEGYLEPLKLLGYLFIILLIFMFSLTIYTYYINHQKINLMREKQQATIEREQLNLLSESNAILRTWKHDNQNILNTISHYLQQGDTEQAFHLLSEYQADLTTSTEINYTGLAVLDAVLSQKTYTIKKADIHYEQKLYLPKELKLPISDVKMCSLLSNMFDNAIEACKKTKNEAFISLSIKMAKMNLMITMENSSDGHYQYDNAGELQSTKEETSIEHGLGIQRIKEIVEEANGIIRIIPEEECFKLTILLPLEDMKHDTQNMRD